MMRRLHAVLERLRDQRGFTLTEVLIAILIFGFVIAMGSMSVVQLAQAGSAAKVRALSSSNVIVGYETLDRQVRYADAINFPGVGASGDAYVEFRIPKAARVDSANPTSDLCVQWRYNPDTGVLQSRRWDAVASPTLPAFSTKARLVTATASATYPFQMIPAAAGGATTQALRITLEAGSSQNEGRTSINTVIVARNSSFGSVSNTDANGDGRSDTPVCYPTGVRP